MSPELYQTHKLFNYRTDTMTATIQCYGYLGGDTVHHETFDYVVDQDTKLHYFRPKSDFDYEEMMEIVRKEVPQKMSAISKIRQSFGKSKKNVTGH